MLMNVFSFKFKVLVVDLQLKKIFTSPKIKGNLKYCFPDSIRGELGKFGKPPLPPPPYLY